MKKSWRKCPSVRPGGNQYFYVMFTINGKISVVWDSLEAQWAVCGDYSTPKQSEAIYGLFPTSDKALKYAEALV